MLLEWSPPAPDRCMEGVVSGRAKAVGEDLMVGDVATSSRSPAGKDLGE